MLELNVKDMTCGHCAGVVTRAVKSVDPQANVQVDLETRRVRIDGRSAARELTGALAAAGYPAVLAGTEAPAVPARRGCCSR